MAARNSIVTRTPESDDLLVGVWQVVDADACGYGHGLLTNSDACDFSSSGLGDLNPVELGGTRRSFSLLRLHISQKVCVIGLDIRQSDGIIEPARDTI